MNKTLVIALYSYVTPLLLVFISFWLVRFVRKVDAIGKILQSLQLSFTAQNATCAEKHIGINAKLINHDDDIKTLQKTTGHHEVEIELLKANRHATH